MNNLIRGLHLLKQASLSSSVATGERIAKNNLTRDGIAATRHERANAEHALFQKGEEYASKAKDNIINQASKRQNELESQLAQKNNQMKLLHRAHVKQEKKNVQQALENQLAQKNDQMKLLHRAHAKQEKKLDDRRKTMRNYAIGGGAAGALGLGYGLSQGGQNKD